MSSGTQGPSCQQPYGSPTSSTWVAIGKGQTCEYVRRAQDTLIRIGYSSVQMTGTLDDATSSAILAEQNKISWAAKTGTIDWDMAVHLGVLWPTDYGSPA